MKPGKTTSVEELQIVSRFEGLREILLSDSYAGHLDKPLAYWALPTDRRLPLAFLGRPLRDLLNMPFSSLWATPGIGRKKMASFVQLLVRAANTDAEQLPNVVLDPAQSDEVAPVLASNDADEFDSASVSEVTWSQWRATVVRHGLVHETLGRLAPSLKNMTRVIWNRSLGEYVDATLGEIRSMRTHGEKRVCAILEVFHAVHGLVANMGDQTHLVVRIIPRRINQVEEWIGNILQQPGIPSQQEIFDNFVGPLLEQIRVDATQQIANLAENRLGLAGPITSVRQAARTLGLTRARIYQLLNEINDIMAVRWPTGRHQVHELRERFQDDAIKLEASVDLQQFCAAVELFYPGNRRGADGPRDITSDMTTLQEDELVEVS
jgi:hypothetical protein